MKHLIIQAVEEEYYRPVIDFNPETGICEMSGESYLEQVEEFFEPLLKWFQEFLSSGKKNLTFNFKLSYYNTSSSKKILEILKYLVAISDLGGKVNINWYYDANDTDIIEDAEDFMMITGLKFNLIKREKETPRTIL